MAELFFTEQLNNPLGIGRGSPTPAAQKFGEDDVGTMEGILTSGRSRLANLQAQETSFSTEKANLTSRLANLVSEQLTYNRQKEEFGAKQKVEESRSNYDNIKKVFDDEINSPQYKEKQRINKEIAEYQVFAPTEVTAPMLGVLFAAIGATGMLLGGNSKNNAKAALSAMNGMAEGFAKGREQYDKERKAAFDTNVKLLQTKLSAIKDGLEDARRESVLNKQAADQKVRETLAANEAQFLQENTNKRGLESTIALVDGQLKNINQATNLLGSKISQLTGQLDSKETQIVMRKIEAARRESEARVREEGRVENARQRHLDRMSEMRLQAALRPETGVQPIGMADGQLMVMDKAGNISSRPLPEGFTGLGKLAEKTPKVSGARDAYGFGEIVAGASNEAAKTLTNIMGLPAQSTSGLFGGRQTTSLFTAPIDAFANKLTPESAQRYQAEMNKLAYYIAQMQKGGRVVGATEVGVINKSLEIRENDTIETVATRLAQARQMAEKIIEIKVASLNTPEPLKEIYKENLKDIQQSVPFTVEDINKFVQRKTGSPTFGESFKERYKTPEPTADDRALGKSSPEMNK
jgi:hypothetical protein